MPLDFLHCQQKCLQYSLQWFNWWWWTSSTFTTFHFKMPESLMQMLNPVFLRSFFHCWFFYNALLWFHWVWFCLVRTLLFLGHIAISTVVIIFHCKYMQARKSLLSLQRKKINTKYSQFQPVFILQKLTPFPPSPRSSPARSSLHYQIHFHGSWEAIGFD